MNKYKKYDQEELKEKLTQLQFKVTQNNHTERPFSNEYYDFFEEGIYVDVTNGRPLFSSKDKFDSSCGWPSFTKPIDDEAVKYIEDFSHGMVRIEVRTKISDAHLGHVFDDGPEDKGGKRFCINSAALDFIPKNKLKEQGYEEYLKLFQ